MALLPAFSFLLLLPATLVASQGLVFPDETEHPNGECTVEPSGGRGWCRPLKDCPPVLEQSLKGIKFKQCGASSHHPIVCCPVSVDRVVDDPSSPITLKTVSPPPAVPECGRHGPSPHPSPTSDLLSVVSRRRRGANVPARGGSFLLGDLSGPPSSPLREMNRPLVVGGKNAATNGWPWMALLGQRRDVKVNWYCDGSLINSRWVLTAAHCLDNGTPHVIRLGEHDKSNDHEGAIHEDHAVSRTVLYPDYRQGGSLATYHDLALIELADEVLFRVGVSPICLPWGKAALRGLHNEPVTITGWGATQYGGLDANILQVAELTVFPSDTCDDSFQILPAYTQKWPQGITEDTFMCAGNPEGGVDSCKGDSGGPLVYKDPISNHFVLRGVVSQGYGCGLQAFPGLYVPVAEQKYLSWIKQVAFSGL